MPSNSTILTVAAVALVAQLTIACAPRNSGKFIPAVAPKIQKNTKTTPQINSQGDEILLAFNELAWARQTAALAIFPISVSTQEGCVTRRPAKSGYFLTEEYRCERQSDASDSAANQRRTLTGELMYTTNSGFYEVNGAFSSEIWQDTTTLVGKGDSTRQTQITIPSGAVGSTQVNDAEIKSSVFKMTSNTDYRGQAPEGRIAEQWSSNVTSGFIFSASKPLTLITGAQVSLSYLQETDLGAKRLAQVVQLTALSDITYAEAGDCLRPVGSFALSNGSTQVGTLTTSALGYTLSTETNVLHAWGKRCLER